MTPENEWERLMALQDLQDARRQRQRAEEINADALDDPTDETAIATQYTITEDKFVEIDGRLLERLP